MKRLLALLLAASPLATAFAGTVITANLPASTAIVNIDARADGSASYNGDQSLWYQPFNSGSTLPQLSLPAGTYQFRVINPPDAALLYPALTAPQTAQIYTAWTYNSPWIEDYLVFDSSALTNGSIPQLFDGAPDPSSFGNAIDAYNHAVATGYNVLIRPGPLGRAGTVFTNSYTLTNAATLIFVIPDYGVGDNNGGVSILVTLLSGPIATTIDAANKYAYAANFGWLDWRGNTNNGAVIGEYVCSGYIYSANFGWINLGNGTPTNGIYYQNISANDFGVNQDGAGNLRGFAYGANIGWINFENNGAAKVNPVTGNLSGYAWSANWGWISLSNSFARVQTDTIQKGALDANGLPIAWELQNFGHTGVATNADPDGDGLNNLQEYLAGTDPNSAASKLAITAESFSVGGLNANITWSSVVSRAYYLQKTPDLKSNLWTDSGLGLIAASGVSTTKNFADTNATARFYRVQAVRPLIP